MSGRSKRTIARRILFSLIPVTVLLLLVETGLRVAGYQSPTADPYESFVLHRPLFVPDGGDLVTSPARARYFHPQRFAREKRPGVTRFFVFGGSVVGGANIPDSARNCFGERLRVRLEREFPGREIEQINCGGKAYASYRLVGLVKECLGYSPDFAVVMSGNNEFLEARHYADLRREHGLLSRVWHDLRIVQLADELGARLRSRGGDGGDGVDSSIEVEPEYIVRSPEEFERTRARYEENLRKIVGLCREKAVPLVLCTVPAKLRDSPPFAMESRGGLSREELCARLDELLALRAGGDVEGALAGAREVISIDAWAGPFHYLEARCLDDLGRYPEALGSYLRAKDTDAFPHRALTSLNETVRRLAEETGTPLVDVEALFLSLARDGIPGEDLFADHCHPNREGHERIARSLAELVVERGLLGR